MLRNRGSGDLISMLDGFRERGIRVTIGAAALVACGLSTSQARVALLADRQQVRLEARQPRQDAEDVPSENARGRLLGEAEQLSPDGFTVYDTVNNVTWLADGDLAATNRFGLPVCSDAANPKACVNQDGSMSYQAATVWFAAMNAANYLGHSDWQLPTTPSSDSSCPFVGPHGESFGFNCIASALGSLYYAELGLKAPNTAVPIPANTVGPFSNFQPYRHRQRSIIQR